MMRGWTICYGSQIYRTRVIEDQLAPQQLFQGLLKYGTIVPHFNLAGSTADRYSDVTDVRYVET